MKKKILLIVGILLGIILIDSIQALILNNNPIIKIKEYYNGGSLNYVSKGILVDTYNCVNRKKSTVIKGFSYTCSYKEIDISLDDINNKIIEYFKNENNDNTNLSYNYVDLDKNKVIVGLVDNASLLQDEFITNVFSNYGSKYVSYVKDNSLIEFRNSKYMFDAKIISAELDTITVEVLEDSDILKKGDKVTMEITRPTSGIIDFYVRGNTIKITFNGNIETSNPMRISAIKIELIS